MSGKSASIMIRILGDGDGAQKAADATEKSFGGLASTIGKVGLGIGAAFGTAAIAAGVFLEKIGATFDDAYDKIAVTTGATGDQLTGLQEDFKNVFKSVPVSAEDASTAIADLNQKLGLTGKPLEDISTQFLNLSRVTDTDLQSNIDSVTKAFNGFGIATGDQGAELDKLFKVSQKTGISVGDLADQMSDGQVAFQAAGLSFDQAASILGTFNKAGLDSSDIVPALSKAMATAAKDGKDAQTVFTDTFNAIKNAPNDTEAAGAALEVFGAKAGPKLAELIRTGKLSLDDFTDAVYAMQPGINETATSTDDWREKLQLLGNKVLVALEPLATKVFGAVGDAVAWATPYIEQFTLWLSENLPKAFAWLQTNVLPVVEKVFAGVIKWDKFLLDTFKEHWPQIRDAVKAAVDWVTTKAWPALKTAFYAVAGAVQWVADKVEEYWPKIKEIVATVVDWIVGTAWPAIKKVADFIGDKFGELVAIVQKHWGEISQAVSDAWVIIQQVVKAAAAIVYVSVMAFVEAVKFIWDNFGTYIVDAMKNAWEFIKSIFSAAIEVITGILAFFKDLFTGNWGALWGDVQRIFEGVWDGLKAYLQLAVDTIILILETAWTAIKLAVQAAWDAIALVISTVWDGIKSGVQSVVDAIKDLLSTTWDAIKSAASTTWEAIKTAITTPITAAKDLISGVWTDIKSAASTAWDGVKTAADTAWNAIKDTVVAPINAAKTAISNVWDAIVGQVGGLPSRIANVAIGMWDGIKNAFKSAINWIIDKWNGLDFTFTLPKIHVYGTDIDIGGNSITWGLPDIPRWAMGAVLSVPTLGIAGDAGPGNPEIVAPKRMIEDIVFDAIASQTPSGMPAGQAMVLRVGDREFVAYLEEVADGRIDSYDRQLAGAVGAGVR